MLRTSQWIMTAALACAASSAVAAQKISVLDYCDQDDPAWQAVPGGCQLKDGDVTLAEFRALLASPLSNAVIGHPAWRFDPSFEELEPNEAVVVQNRGGENHTFTEVANYGGGLVPPLNAGFTQTAPECASATILRSGDRVMLRALPLGAHKFQCCIHPWMRALIKVEKAND